MSSEPSPRNLGYRIDHLLAEMRLSRQQIERRIHQLRRGMGYRPQVLTIRKTG